MEKLQSINWPFGGLSETFAFGDQEPGSARDYQNVRGLCPRTGRLRGAQRSGLSQYLTSYLKTQGTKVADLIAFFIDNRGVTYTAIASGSETVTWDGAVPSNSTVLNIKTDRQGNLYALDGNAAIAKYSADSTLLWQLAIPVGDTNHVVRALFVDDFDAVYAAVSSGGEQSKAKLFCYEQLPENKTEKLWEIETKAYVEQIVVANSKLYTIQNHTDRNRAYVRIYEFFDTANPEMTKEWRVPYPANSIAVKKSGEVVVGCAPSGDTTGYYWRLPDPKFPDFSVDSEDWTPRQLTDYDKRVWGWWVADDIDQSDVTATLEDGVMILRWRDRTKNNRHIYAPLDETANASTSPIEGPVLSLDALLGHKGVRFNAEGPYSSTKFAQALRSYPNSTIAKAFADNQRTMVPTYTDSSFALFIVCRPSQSLPDGDNTPRFLWGQDRDNAASGSDDHIIFVNANDDSGNTLPPNGDAGGVYWYQGQVMTSGGGGAGGVINAGDFDVKPGTATANPGNFVIIACVNDGGISGDSQEGLFQINGNPIDKFLTPTSTSLRPTYLGIYKATPGSSSLSPSSGVSGFLGDVVEILVLDRKSRTDATQNVLTYDSLEATSGATSQTINEMTTIVGYLAHKYGAQANLPFGTAATNNYPHPFGITGTSPDQVSGPPNQGGSAVSSAQALANKRFGATVKYSAEGRILWCANEMASGDGSRPGGFGYAVAVNSDGNIYSLGPNPTGGSGGTQQVRMIVDQGTTFSISSSDGAWSVSFPGSFNQTNEYPIIDVDEFDNLYIPYDDGASSTATLRVYQKTGTLLHSKLLTSPQRGKCIAVDRRIPDYRNDLSPKTVEHVFVGGVAASLNADTIAKVRLVSAAQSGASPRSLTTMGVSGGDIVKFTTSGVTTPTGGSGALDSGAYVQSTSLFKKVYWTDGRQYKQYDPTTNEITSYVATSAGQMPARCALIESWRGRIVLARSADEPHNWFLSKKDEPQNFDFFPPVPGETDAVAGNNSPAGLCPDIINSIVPYSEDILVFGCDHSIWMLVGDPAAGGRLELVSDITGMAFGRPWTKDPNGILYFFGSQGGVFRWAPGARPERVSLHKIERQLQDVDLSAYFIRLVYNYRDEGLHIFQCPFGAGGTSVSHWFLELKTSAFAKDVFGSTSSTNVQPTACVAIDGDDFADRVLLIGCEDGKVRKWDSAARSDDVRTDGSTNNAIVSRVTWLLPSMEEAAGLETQFSGLQVVLGDQDQGARYELYASDEPESIGVARRTGSLYAGRNPPKWDRVVGAYCFLSLQNSAAEERWSFERATLRASIAGLARPRITT